MACRIAPKTPRADDVRLALTACVEATEVTPLTATMAAKIADVPPALMTMWIMAGELQVTPLSVGRLAIAPDVLEKVLRKRNRKNGRA